MSNIFSSKKNGASLRCHPPVSGWWHLTPCPGDTQPPCSPAEPCPWLRLQNVHCSASLLQPAVARELLKVKKTAQDERGAAAEGWQAGGWWTGRGKGEGGERSRGEEGAGHGVGISSHLYHRAAAPCPVQACLLLVQLPLI